MQRIDFLLNNNYNPLKQGIFLARSIVDLLNNLEPFTTIFNGNIYDYYRDDNAAMGLPAMCVNVDTATTVGKHYFIHYPIEIDIFLPTEVSHYVEANARANIMALLDTFFKRPSVQKYLSKANYGFVDIAGLKAIAETANLRQLGDKRSVRIMSFKCTARIDRLIYNRILIERFGVSPSSLTLDYSIPRLQGVRTQLVDAKTNLPIN